MVWSLNGSILKYSTRSWKGNSWILCPGHGVVYLKLYPSSRTVNKTGFFALFSCTAVPPSNAVTNATSFLTAVLVPSHVALITSLDSTWCWTEHFKSSPTHLYPMALSSVVLWMYVKELFFVQIMKFEDLWRIMKIAHFSAKNSSFPEWSL